MHIHTTHKQHKYAVEGPRCRGDYLVKFRAASQAAVTLISSVAVGQTFMSADLSVERACCEFGMTACSIIEASALVVLVK